jgi:antibiotic biosynthesis monooxygenase (ABM) superfamily enzyme
MSQSVTRSDRATLVIAHRVNAGEESQYEDWLNRMAVCEAQAPGFIGREVIFPIADGQDWYTSVIKFDSPETLAAWTVSPNCRQMVAEAESMSAQVLRSGAQPQSDGLFLLGSDEQAPEPATWKVALIVLIGLYPSIFAISWLFTFRIEVPFALRLLIGNILAVSVVSFVTTPIARRIFRNWLRARRDAVVTNVVGALVIGLSVLCMLGVFLLVPSP